MEYLIIGIIAAAAIVIFSTYEDAKRKRKAYADVEAQFGTFGDYEFSEEKLSSLNSYSDSKKNDLYVDEITWSDLSMQEVFKQIDNCGSCIGEEYLFYMLKNPVKDQSVLEERERIISLFSSDRKKTNDLRYTISSIGRLKNISFYEYIFRLKNIRRDSSVIHIIQLIAFTAATVSIVFVPPIGIVLTLIMFFVNIVTYFKRKGEIEAYYSVLTCFINILKASDRMVSLEIPELKAYFDRLHTASQKFSGLRKRSFMVLSSRDGVMDIMQSILDYFRMALHIDLIFFNKMLDIFFQGRDSFEEIFEIIGMLDALANVASYRAALPEYTVPEFIPADRKLSLNISDVYHPLIPDAVRNSISEERSCLITGSNASGKSTFIRTVAIASLLAETIHTVPASSYRAPVFKIMSSMALKDNILNGESYYMVEIRSLKRIFDSVGDVPVLCFIDEVLRGTNTLERVAASAKLLSALAGYNAVVFAATHDLELTYILEQYFSNYHFEEQVTENDVLFDYMLREGRSRSRNAIKLLERFGFDKEITSGAADVADQYVKTNSWPVL